MEPEDERYARTNNCQPTHFATLVTAEQLPGFGAREEHQQEQAEPVDEIQNARILFNGFR